MNRRWILTALSLVVVACGGMVGTMELGLAEDEAFCGEVDDTECDGVMAVVRGALAAAGNWHLPRAVKEAGQQQHVSYDSPPPWNGGSNCSGGMTSGARILGDYLVEHFRSNMYQGYACRTIRGTSNSMSVHGTGRALDVFITLDKGSADNDKGDPIANWLVEHAEEIGIQYIVWDRTQWKGYTSGTKDSYYGGVHPHHDHLHIELTQEASRKQTPWFKQKKYRVAPDDNGLAAKFDVSLSAAGPSRVNVTLRNESARAFENIKIDYEVPDRLTVDQAVVTVKRSGAMSWERLRVDDSPRNNGTIELQHLAPGAAKRIVLQIGSKTGLPTSGTVKAWVRRMDEHYGGATAFDVKPTKNAFDSILRAKVVAEASAPTVQPNPPPDDPSDPTDPADPADPTDPADPVPPAQELPCGGTQSYEIPPLPDGMTTWRALRLARLYCAFFDRAPRDGGMTRRMEAMAAGRTTGDISDAFWQSDEFRASRGDWKTMGNRQFIRTLYREILLREPTEAGVDYWIELMQDGTPRSRIINKFAQSDEFRVMTEAIWK